MNDLCWKWCLLPARQFAGSTTKCFYYLQILAGTTHGQSPEFAGSLSQ